MKRTPRQADAKPQKAPFDYCDDRVELLDTIKEIVRAELERRECERCRSNVLCRMAETVRRGCAKLYDTVRRMLCFSVSDSPENQ